MRITLYTSSKELQESPERPAFDDFLVTDEHSHFFQSPEFLGFIAPVEGYRPVLFLAHDHNGKVHGSLLGCYQRDGGMLKSWLSRRLIIWGGPLGGSAAAGELLGALLKDAASQAIYVEFRNYFDTVPLRQAFEEQGFTYRPHLNFVLELGDEEAALKRISSNRRRQIKASVAAGAEYGEATTEQDVKELYQLLETLYRKKVGKPLPSYALFHRMHTSPSGRIFVVKHGGRVIGGSAGPVYKNKILYQWYVCGDNSIKGVHASVLATWAQIEHGARHGYNYLDFMGAGRPGQGYGVHDFKARFGGVEVSHGRYEKVLERPLYALGVLGLKVYHRLMGDTTK